MLDKLKDNVQTHTFRNQCWELNPCVQTTEQYPRAHSEDRTQDLLLTGKVL